MIDPKNSKMLKALSANNINFERGEYICAIVDRYQQANIKDVDVIDFPFSIKSFNDVILNDLKHVATSLTIETSKDVYLPALESIKGSYLVIENKGNVILPKTFDTSTNRLVIRNNKGKIIFI